MKKNYSILFLMFFAASITGGLALKSLFTYSMIVGVGLGIFFLFCTIYSLKKAIRLPNEDKI